MSVITIHEKEYAKLISKYPNFIDVYGNKWVIVDSVLLQVGSFNETSNEESISE